MVEKIQQKQEVKHKFVGSYQGR